MDLWKRILFENREVPNAIFTKSYLWWRIKPAAWGMAPRSQTVDFRRFEATTLPFQTCTPLQINVLCFFETWLPSDSASYRWRPESSIAWLWELQVFGLFRLQIYLPLAVDGKAKRSFQRFHFCVFFSNLESGRLKVSLMKQQIDPTQRPTVLQETDRQTDSTGQIINRPTLQ